VDEVVECERRRARVVGLLVVLVGTVFGGVVFTVIVVFVFVVFAVFVTFAVLVVFAGGGGGCDSPAGDSCGERSELMSIATEEICELRNEERVR